VDPVSERSRYHLDGNSAIVTGASSGIGAAIARELGWAGANVLVNYSGNTEGANQVVQEITANGGRAFAFKADVSQGAEVQAMFQAAREAYGTVDILVNNAGVQRDAPFLEMTLEQWNRVLEINLTGAFLCAREAAREFVRRGICQERSCVAGKIIFVSSVHEVIPWAGHVNYAASKGGLMLLMKSIAQELGSLRIRVNSIAPGAIKTPINRPAWETPEAEAKLLGLIPVKRVGEPQDIAKAAVWLASEDASYVHGVTLFVDGGMTLYPAFAIGG
jgi:glucose 1-dehydrogenase